MDPGQQLPISFPYVSRLQEARLHDGEFNPVEYGRAGACGPLGDTSWRLEQPQDITQGRLSGIDCTKMAQTVTVGGDGSYRWGGFLQKGKAIRGSDPFAECKACV